MAQVHRVRGLMWKGEQREGSWLSFEHSCPEESWVHQVTLCVNRSLKAAAGLALAQD